MHQSFGTINTTQKQMYIAYIPINMAFFARTVLFCEYFEPKGCVFWFVLGIYHLLLEDLMKASA